MHIQRSRVGIQLLTARHCVLGKKAASSEAPYTRSFQTGAQENSEEQTLFFKIASHSKCTEYV